MPRKRKTQSMEQAPPPYPHLEWLKRHHAKVGQVSKPLVIRSKPLGRLERDLADLMVTATVEQGSYQKRLIITCNREILWTSRFDGADEALAFAQAKFEQILASERKADMQLAKSKDTVLPGFNTEEATAGQAIA